MLRKTPARDAGTWWIPQFHKNVVMAVQARPLMARAIQAVVLTWAKGGGEILVWRIGLKSIGPSIHSASMVVPVRML